MSFITLEHCYRGWSRFLVHHPFSMKYIFFVILRVPLLSPLIKTTSILESFYKRALGSLWIT